MLHVDAERESAFAPNRRSTQGLPPLLHDFHSWWRLFKSNLRGRRSCGGKIRSSSVFTEHVVR